MWLHELIIPSDYKETPMPFYKTTNSFFSHAQLHVSKTILKPFQWSRYYSKVFESIFEIFPESVPILEFLAPLQVFQGLLMLTIKSLI
jgi:hypothetical protein